MKIGELALRFGIATSKVRFLETRGLVRARRLASGYRDYDEDAAEMLGIVLRAQAFGFSLDEIASAFAEAPGRRPHCDVLLPHLATKLAELDRHLAETATLREQVAAMMTELERRVAARRKPPRAQSAARSTATASKGSARTDASSRSTSTMR